MVIFEYAAPMHFWAVVLAVSAKDVPIKRVLKLIQRQSAAMAPYLIPQENALKWQILR
jgi:hypothetical protein